MREYKASKLRFAMTFAFFVTLGTTIIRTVIYLVWDELGSPSLFALVVSAAIFLVIGLFVSTLIGMWLFTPAAERLSITLTNHTISGPPLRGAKRVTIPLARIDWGKSESETLFQKLFGHRYIYSIDGERIVLSGFAFNRATMSEFLEQIRFRSDEP